MFVLKRAAVALLLAASLPALAASSGPAPLRIVQRISGPDGHWDYASFDAARRRVYVAHGDTVLSLDVDSGKLDAAFAKGSHLHAVVPVPGADRIVTTNSGDNTAKVIDAKTGAVLASIPAAADTDSAAYDPATGLVVVIGGDSGEITLVDPRAMRAVGSIKVGEPLEFGAPDGKGRFFVNGVAKGEIVVIDLKTKSVAARWPMTGCKAPTGLAYVAGERLVSACNGLAKIVSTRDGAEIASLPIGPRPDAVIYDPKRAVAYIPSGGDGALAEIALEGPNANTIVATAKTQVGTRTGAVDPKTGRVFLPTAQFAPPAQPGQRPQAVPGTFQMLVLDR
jgi:DNA-binding beta-propeller fold protein YncE